jgi:LAO/AO transport system kinase
VTHSDADDLASSIRTGSIRALARGLSWIESGRPEGEQLMERLYPHSGRAHVIGITGAPGAGKSTLTTALTRVIREHDLSVGIIAVDPSSPFSGGSILGDRIRMTDIGGDPGVFIRSMATRGALGGLCAAARDSVDLLDAAGKRVVIVETVGVGQDEIDIMRLAHTVVVVSVPGLGDDIQAMKAGLIEIADIHIVNKADRDGADRTIAELQNMLALSMPATGAWTTPVVPSVATTSTGAVDLFDHVRRHAAFLKDTGEWRAREQRMAEARVLKLAQQIVAAALADPIDTHRALVADAMTRVAARELSPLACARLLLGRVSSQGGSQHVR